MDEFGDLIQAKLLCSLAEDKEHCINYIRLATSVRPNHRGKSFVERTNLLNASITFEILKRHVCDDETLIRGRLGRAFVRHPRFECVKFKFSVVLQPVPARPGITMLGPSASTPIKVGPTATQELKEGIAKYYCLERSGQQQIVLVTMSID
jgi:hypothetical protein